MDGPRVLTDKPPMWEQINAVFDVAGKNVIFAWGDRIYNPTGGDVPPHLMVHEQIHLLRQAKFGMALDLEQRVKHWWLEYIADPKFRLAEEIPAHIAEYHALLKIHGNNRVNRRRFSRQVANRLASPLYGSLIKASQVRKRLEETLRA